MQRVIYRVITKGPVYLLGDVFAIFPDQVDRGLVTSYATVGQHSDGDYHLMLAHSRPATPDEYCELHRELTDLVGYDDLRIVRV